jgi:hypothetical protein
MPGHNEVWTFNPNPGGEKCPWEHGSSFDNTVYPPGTFGSQLFCLPGMFVCVVGYMY